MPEIFVPRVLAHVVGGVTVLTIDNKPLLVGDEIPLDLLADYARGSIIRGGTVDWEAYDSKTIGAILIGDGADVISTTTPTFAGIVTFTNTGLHILDTDASHDLRIVPGSDLTADRTLTLTTGDASRTITLSGNPTLDDWFDQSVKMAASPTFANVFVPDGGTFGITGNELLTVNAAGTFAFSGISGVSVEDGDWIGTAAGTSWKFDDGNDISTLVNVGIGTAAPDQMLEIEGANARIHLDGSNAQLFVDRSAVGNRGEVIYQTAGVSKWYTGMADSGELGDGSEFFIGTSGGGASPAVVIETDGKFGINTVPLTQLHVAEQTAATTTRTNMVTISQSTSGTAAGGFGSSTLYRLEDGGGNTPQAAVKIGAVWGQAGSGIEFPLGYISTYPKASESLLPFGVWAVDDLSTTDRVVVPSPMAVQSFFWARYTLVDTLGGTITSTVIGGVAPGATYDLYSAGGNTYRLEVTVGGVVNVVKSVSGDGSTAKLRLIIQYV